MEDGSMAVGLFNRGEYENSVKVNWKDLGISDNQTVRDLWRQKDVGKFNNSFTAKVARHGAMLIRVIPNNAKN